MSAHPAVTLTRWWARVYTVGLPPDIRAARCDEIDSDLWESLHDPDVSQHQILPRLLAGLADDVRWRAGYLAEESRTMWLTISSGALLIVAMWEWLARPAVARLIAESIWFYPIVESVHVLAIVLFLGLTVMLDLRLLGLTLRRIPVSDVVSWILPWAAPGGLLAVVSGMLTFLADGERYATNPFFLIKSAALVLAVINVIVFHMTVYPRVREWDLLPTPPRAARLSAAFSLTLWTLVVVTSRFIAYNWFA